MSESVPKSAAKSPLFQQENEGGNGAGVEEPLIFLAPLVRGFEDGKDNDEHEHVHEEQKGRSGRGTDSGTFSGTAENDAMGGRVSPTIVEGMDNTMFHSYPVTPGGSPDAKGSGLRKGRGGRRDDTVSRASKVSERAKSEATRPNEANRGHGKARPTRKRYSFRVLVATWTKPAP